MNLYIVEIQTQRRPLPLLQYNSALSAGLVHRTIQKHILALPLWGEWVVLPYPVRVRSGYGTKTTSQCEG